MSFFQYLKTQINKYVLVVWVIFVSIDIYLYLTSEQSVGFLISYILMIPVGFTLGCLITYVNTGKGNK